MRLPNGYGGVVCLGKKRRRPYAARITSGWTDEGKAIYKYLGYFEKKTDALQCLAEYNLNPYDVDSRKLTFAEVYEMWAEKELKGATQSKIASYATAFKNCECVHNIKITELKVGAMQKAVDNCGKRSASTLSNIKKLFSQVSKFSLENDFITKDYSSFVKFNDVDDKKSKKEFTEDEIQILWNNKDNFYCRLILVLIYTGFRINELLQLKIENTNLQEGTLTGGLKTKAGKNRIVPIHPRIMPFIKELYDSSQCECLVTKDGKPLRYDIFRVAFDDVLQKLGMSHTPHECRHTTATLLDKYGANPTSIKRILGHSAQDVTSSIYIHKDITELKKAIRVIP